MMWNGRCMRRINTSFYLHILPNVNTENGTETQLPDFIPTNSYEQHLSGGPTGQLYNFIYMFVNTKCTEKIAENSFFVESYHLI